MKLPEGLIEHDGARLFGRKDIEAVVRDCAAVAKKTNAPFTEFAILSRYGLSEVRK